MALNTITLTQFLHSVMLNKASSPPIIGNRDLFLAILFRPFWFLTLKAFLKYLTFQLFDF